MADETPTLVAWLEARQRIAGLNDARFARLLEVPVSSWHAYRAGKRLAGPRLLRAAWAGFPSEADRTEMARVFVSNIVDTSCTIVDRANRRRNTKRGVDPF